MDARGNAAGFSLFEGIVIAVVIYILFAVFATVAMEWGSMESVNSTRVGNQAKNVVVAIITENMNREGAGRGRPSVWPRIGQIDPEYSNSVFTAESSANSYFAWLIEDHVVETLTGYRPFAGGGVKVASDGHDFRTKEHNVWSVVANLDTEPVGDPPFLFTRNLRPTATMLRDDDGLASAWTPKRCWQVNKTRFVHNRAIVVTRGASVDIVHVKDMSRSRFVGDAVFSSETNKDVAIWYAVGTE